MQAPLLRLYPAVRRAPAQIAMRHGDRGRLLQQRHVACPELRRRRRARDFGNPDMMVGANGPYESEAACDEHRVKLREFGPPIQVVACREVLREPKWLKAFGITLDDDG